MNENRIWALSEIYSGESTRIVNGLLSLAFYDDDYEFVENLCIEYSNHFDDRVRGLAILCFGHLARIHGKLHIDRVAPIVKGALKDKSEYVRGQAICAKDDINFFLKIEI
ncbi:MAG: hypothetical protein Q8936_13440 [Bacillota bacterium]|nr:hypothetical protein [Bacillota bacterium]